MPGASGPQASAAPVDGRELHPNTAITSEVGWGESLGTDIKIWKFSFVYDIDPGTYSGSIFLSRRESRDQCRGQYLQLPGQPWEVLCENTGRHSVYEHGRCGGSMVCEHKGGMKCVNTGGKVEAWCV